MASCIYRCYLDSSCVVLQTASTTIEIQRNLLIEKLNQLDEGDDEKSVITELVGDYTVMCDNNLFVMHIEVNHEVCWLFTIKTFKKSPKRKLERIFLLHDSDLFSLRYVFLTKGSVSLPKNSQIWENTIKDEAVVQIMCLFSSKKYGNFLQDLVFDFGDFPKLVRKIGVQVTSEEIISKMLVYDPGKQSDDELSWLQRYNYVPINGKQENAPKTMLYQLPPNIEDLVRFDAFKYLSPTLNKKNYRERQHMLLYIEEFQKRAELKNISFHIDDFQATLKSNKIDTFTSSIACEMHLVEEIVRLVGRTGKALIRLNNLTQKGELYVSDNVFEVAIRSIKSNTVLFQLPEQLFILAKESVIPVDVDICFCLSDTFAIMHEAVDKVNLDILFPKKDSKKFLPFCNVKSARLSLTSEQFKATQMILDPNEKPFILLLGPFGSGKTRTLANAIDMVLSEESSRLLVCTHSNSAADHYIEEYFHPLHGDLTEFNHRPLRINWEHRFASSVSDRVLAYCHQDRSTGYFAKPEKCDLDKHSLIISTLSTSIILSQLDLPQGYFTHIIIDEAAQAIETEAIIPLLLASKETTVVLAGDHMQMCGLLTSTVASDLGLGRSLLERLFCYYSFGSEYKMMLLENFRSYKEIVYLSSELFYGNSLTSNKIKPNGSSFPISFYGVDGTEELSDENPSYQNIEEVNEILQRVNNLVDGTGDHNRKIDQCSICIVAFYSAQVRKIRYLLRRNGRSQVRVESVNNIQGLEFDVMIISTVRTCSSSTNYDYRHGVDLAFFCNPRLLNTAITRARHEIIFVGDPMALIKIGACVNYWKHIIELCSKNETFFYRLSSAQLFTYLANYDSNYECKSIKQNQKELKKCTIYKNLLTNANTSNIPCEPSRKTTVPLFNPYVVYLIKFPPALTLGNLRTKMIFFKDFALHVKKSSQNIILDLNKLDEIRAQFESLLDSQEYFEFDFLKAIIVEINKKLDDFFQYIDVVLRTSQNAQTESIGTLNARITTAHFDANKYINILESISNELKSNYNLKLRYQKQVSEMQFLNLLLYVFSWCAFYPDRYASIRMDFVESKLEHVKLNCSSIHALVYSCESAQNGMFADHDISQRSILSQPKPLQKNKNSPNQSLCSPCNASSNNKVFLQSNVNEIVNLPCNLPMENLDLVENLRREGSALYDLESKEDIEINNRIFSSKDDPCIQDYVAKFERQNASKLPYTNSHDN